MEKFLTILCALTLLGGCAGQSSGITLDDISNMSSDARSDFICKHSLEKLDRLNGWQRDSVLDVQSKIKSGYKIYQVCTEKEDRPDDPYCVSFYEVAEPDVKEEDGKKTTVRDISEEFLGKKKKRLEKLEKEKADFSVSSCVEEIKNRNAKEAFEYYESVGS